MSKKITVELSGAWVLKHRGDDKLPIPYLWEQLERTYASGMKLLHTSLTSFSVEIDEAVINPAELQKTIDTLFCNTYSEQNASDVLSISVEDMAPVTKTAEEKKKEEETASAEGRQEKAPDLSSYFKQGESSDREETPKESAAARIEALIGADSFK